MTMRERLEAAIGPCVIVGGKELHLGLILTICQKAKGQA